MFPIPYRIVVGLDLSEYAEIVLEHAIDAASGHTGAELHFVAVAEAESDEDERARAMATLVRPVLEELGFTEAQLRFHVRVGDPATEITDLAAELRAHLIVIGRFGVHHPNRKMGEIATRVIERAPSATLVVGLTDQTPDAIQQCRACVAVREDSDGDRWFCDAHTDHVVPVLVSSPASRAWSGDVADSTSASPAK